MAGVYDYSTTAGSNTTVGGVSIAEGMAPGNVNNGMRAQMADARKWQLDWSGVVTAGAGNAYTITSNQGVSAYADGMRISFRADRNNTGAATLNVDGRGAKALRKVSAGALTALAADDIVAEAVYDVVYDLSSDVFVIVGFAGLQASAFMQTVLDDATAADARTTLGVVIGTNVQAQGATLTSLEGLTLAAGDILYATAADTLTNLAKGTDGQFLTLASGVPAWATGGRVLLATKAASASTALTFTEFNNTAYRYYEFEFEALVPATTGGVLRVRFSSNGGSSYLAGASDYTWGLTFGNSGGGGQDGSGADSAIDASVAVTTSAFGVNGSLKLRNASSTTVSTALEFQTSGQRSGISSISVAAGVGALAATSATNAIRFFFSSGNITSGTIRMYGVI